MTADLSSYEQDLLKAAVQGEDVRDARLRPMFRMMFTKFRTDAIKARDALCTVDPEDAKAIRILQNEVLRFEESADMVRTALIEGEQAFQQLQSSRGERSEEPEE